MRASGGLEDRVAIVNDLCRSLGFARWGVARAESIEHERELNEWLEAGRHGLMTWLEQHRSQRIDPRNLLDGARSVIVVADRYGDDQDQAKKLPSEHPAARTGLVALYARGDDYHVVLKDRLHELCDALSARFPGERFRACVDTAPVVEREHAARAGVGYIGKNTMVIEPGVGSYFFLGEVVTTLELAIREDDRAVVGDHCGTCTRCIDACPTGALEPYRMDARRCISYLTIEHRAEIAPEFHEPMGRWIFGCDVCQDVCPHNGGDGVMGPTRVVGGHSAYHSRHGERFDLLAVLNWTEDDRRIAFAKSAMKRAKLWMMKRNAIIAAGNYLRDGGDDEDGALRKRIEQIAGDEAEHEAVRSAADAALAMLARATGPRGPTG